MLAADPAYAAAVANLRALDGLRPEDWGATAHTVRVRTVYHDMVRRGAPVPVPEVRAGGPYRGAPRTAGTKGKLHRSLCAPSVGGK